MKVTSNALYGFIGALCLAGTIASAQNLAPVAPNAAKSSSSQSNQNALAKDFNKQPTYVKSDTLNVNSEQRIFIYGGNVEVRQADMTLTCDTLEGHYNQQNKIDTLTAKGNVTMVKGSNIRGTGQKLVYDAATETAVFTEAPELQQDDSILTADLIRVFLKENRSVAEGTVRVKMIKKSEMKNPVDFVPTK